MNQQELKHILSSKFDFDQWKDLLGTMFLKIDYLTKPIQIEAALVKSGGQVGVIRLDDGRSLGLFKFEVADNIKIARNRKGLRDIAIKYVDQDITHGALVFYYSEDQADYRLTFVSKQTSLNEDGEFVTKATAPKRYTFLLGENEPCTTAANRLLELINKKKSGSVYLADVTEAFSVERLNKDFFKGYKDQYGKFLNYIGEQSKANRDYVKKLLGRLVFLQFLQKKGWMGVPVNNTNWEGGDKNYLNNLIENYKGNNRLLSDVLEVLFFNTLNEKRDNDLADKILGENIKIPYLNGGLFDKDSLDKLDIDFPYDYFKELMEFFAMYNFTIDENDPDDAEVGVDPEMLGHIFENLLEDNKDKGAFYTPKEIVQYMSQESIAQYLKTHTEETLHSAIEVLIKERKVDEVLQNKVSASKVYDLLRDVKVCDPAIGSGAFPMGVLNVLYHSRQVLYGFTKSMEPFSPAVVKREIIQNNIYGVDIEQGAIDIARLRFWLALVVDELKPEPLPNLDYKIMQGNSLVEQFENLDLSDLLPKKNEDGLLLVFDEETQLQAILHEKQCRYFSTTDHEEKQTLRNEIVKIVKDLIIERTQGNTIIPEKLQTIDLSSNDQFFLWHTWFADVYEEGGFDVVIGNPPWGSDLSMESKTLLKKLYPEIDSSTPNSFAYFIGWGLRNSLSSLLFVLPDSILIKDFKKTRELMCSKVREVKWYQNCSVPREKRLFRDVEHDICIVCLDMLNHSHVHFQTNNYENGNYVPKDVMVLKNLVFREEFDFVFNLKASSTDWIIASKLLKHQPLGDIAQCHEGIHSGNIRNKLFIKGYKPNLKPMYYGGKAGDIIRPYVSYLNDWYVDYRASLINSEIGEYASLRDERLFIYPKIYITRTGNPFKAFYDENSYASNNFFSLQIKEYEHNTRENLLFILPFINSKVCQFFIRKFAAPRLGDSFVETKIIHLLKFPIPYATSTQRDSLLSLVGQILKAKKDSPQADTREMEQQIDLLVYYLYGLTYEEVLIVDPETPITKEEYWDSITDKK